MEFTVLLTARTMRNAFVWSVAAKMDRAETAAYSGARLSTRT